MHVSHLVVKNFRGLEDIQIDLVPRMNVIVGPNAIGKTTVLHALRLPKALAAPRTPNEAQQLLFSLGASSPHFPNRFLVSALARDPAKAVEVRCKYVLTDSEIELLAAAVPTVVNNLLQSRLGQGFANPTVMIQFLNSTQGREMYMQVTDEVSASLQTLQQNKHLILGVSISPNAANIQTNDPVGAVYVAFLDQRLEPHLTNFSFFPADRALPPGEVPVQLGAADTQQQLESHNSQPQLKYTRLKNTIFSTVIRSEGERRSLQKTFDEIFTALLSGRRVLGPAVNEIGLLTVLVEEIESRRRFDMDSLSSGEKGLILTYLLIAKSMNRGGIVLLDEPELHLNPAVCRDILPFMIEHYGNPMDLQFVICSHSPQILTSAFENEAAALHHLESPTKISKVGRRAYDEMADALHKLGTSVSESLMYKGTILVEGEDDERLLTEAFADILRRYKISDRGGRREIEKTIKKLQSLEERGEKVDPIFLIFDHDNMPTDLRSSNAVKVMQWPRYCIENYLIDIEALTLLLKGDDVVKEPILKEADVVGLLRELAYKQLDDLATRSVYSELGYKSPSFRVEDIDGKSIEQVAEFLYERVSTARASLPDRPRDSWVKEFTSLQNTERDALGLAWETNWRERCNGKRLFKDLQQTGNIKISPLMLKRRIIQQMKSSNSENWTLLSGLVTKLLSEQ